MHFNRFMHGTLLLVCLFFVWVLATWQRRIALQHFATAPAKRFALQRLTTDHWRIDYDVHDSKHSSFTGTLSVKFAISLQWLLRTPPHLKHVATLPREILLSENWLNQVICEIYYLSRHSERSMTLQLCTCLEFVGSDPALKAPTDRGIKLHYVKHGPIQPKPADGFKRSDDGRCFRSDWYPRFPWLE